MKTLTRFSKLLLFLTLCVGVAVTASANKNGPTKVGISSPVVGSNNIGYRADCAPASAQVDLDVNNVRARLLNGGDMWWDLSNGRYIVPKVAAGSGIKEVSSMFAGAIWVGGFDAGGNLKMAAQTYRQNGNDFWPGPLVATGDSAVVGTTTKSTCASWDRHFTVRGPNIDVLVKQLLADDNGNGIPNWKEASWKPDCSTITADLKGWPAKGNPYFTGIYGYPLPDQDLAPFYDRSGDGAYDPCDGDFPIIEVRCCESPLPEKQRYADEMIWWVYNDNGAANHGETKGQSLHMEIQTLAFSWAKDNAINDMTFYRCKLINRGATPLDSTHMGLWSDPDLGCYLDDYIGCSVGRQLGYVYNSTTPDPIICTDGTTGGSSNGYGTNIPILGVDYFRGPSAKAKAGDPPCKDLGMSSFMYYVNNRGAGATLPPSMLNPVGAHDYYAYLTGTWRDDSPLTGSSSGFHTSGAPTKYAFPDAPNDQAPTAWSMANINFPGYDMRFIQTSGPFRLDPGKVNEIIFGLVWVPNQSYPRPPLADLYAADDIAQSLFTSCFATLKGPEAPDVNIVELDQELILTINNKPTSNNYNEGYLEPDPSIPGILAGNTDTTYRFQGYRVYQLPDANLQTGSALDDDSKAKLVASVDIKDGITTITNWQKQTTVQNFIGIQKALGAGDNGVQHSFHLTTDQFSSGDNVKLINHKKYYYEVVAYAYNNWKTFDPSPSSPNRGQQTPYIQSNSNVYVYTAIPRRPEAELLGAKINAHYGDSPEITRMDGVGNNGATVDLTKASRDAIVAANGAVVPMLTYQKGFGPINVQVYDPLRVAGGDYILDLLDDNADSTLNADASKVTWKLYPASNPTQVWTSQTSINRPNEQLIPELGISITVAQQVLPGDASGLTTTNGYVSSSITYADDSKKWFYGVSDADPRYGIGTVDFIKNELNQSEAVIDPKKVYNGVLSGQMYPFKECDCRKTGTYYTPGWMDESPDDRYCLKSINATAGITPVGRLGDLNNVDIVFTSDTSKWSRCIVLETTNKRSNGGFTAPDKTRHMNIRGSRSVDKMGQTVASDTSTGLGWFPGYAIDVVTGRRVNIFFGEASLYSPGSTLFRNLSDSVTTGGDLMYNPQPKFFLPGLAPGQPSPFQIAVGGHHYVYVTADPYDGCKSYYNVFHDPIHHPTLEGAPTAGTPKFQGNKASFLQRITWTSMTGATIPLLPISQGIIPTETTIKLRVTKPYAAFKATNAHNQIPRYQFSLGEYGIGTVTATTRSNALEDANVVPNPYYGYSAYEINALANTVKITNLPAKCVVTIYSLDGKFIRQYNRDEGPRVDQGRNSYTTQINPAIEWDLKNSKAIPVASGVYLIHIKTDDAERVIKWFGIARSVDAQGL